MQVIRTKNQFVLQEGEPRGGYKACILNVRYTDPQSKTFAKMAKNNKEKWDKYINMKTKDRHQSNARKVGVCFLCMRLFVIQLFAHTRLNNQYVQWR